MPKGIKGFQKGVYQGFGFKKGNHPETEFKKGQHSVFCPPKTIEHKKKIGDTLKRKGIRPPIQHLIGERNPAWKGGISFEPYSVNWTETLKRSIRERDHYICQLCLEYGLIVHHKDYDKKNCCPDNLIILCKKCHCKTNNNRSYWIKFWGMHIIKP